MLAPVLARLAGIAGIERAEVDCSGTFFLVSAATTGALERALPAIRDALGPTARRIEGAARDAQLETRPRGEIWFSTDSIRGLSYVEGRVLATHMGDAVKRSVVLEPRAAEQVVEATRAEIFAALDEAHDTGGRTRTDWFWEEWPKIVDRIAGRLEPALPPSVCADLVRALRAQGRQPSCSG